MHEAAASPQTGPLTPFLACPNPSPSEPPDLLWWTYHPSLGPVHYYLCYVRQLDTLSTLDCSPNPFLPFFTPQERKRDLFSDCWVPAPGHVGTAANVICFKFTLGGYLYFQMRELRLRGVKQLQENKTWAPDLNPNTSQFMLRTSSSTVYKNMDKVLGS